MSIVKREWKIKGTIVIRGWKLWSREDGRNKAPLS